MKNKVASTTRFFWLYTLGALLTISLAAIAAWADLEAAFYGFYQRGSEPVKGFYCPILMNKNEAGVVSLRIKNTTDKTLSPSVRMEFSTPGVAASDLRTIQLSPGETRHLTWKISSENIDLKYFIFSKIFIYSFYPIPDSEGTCGTFIINVPIPGNVLLVLWVALGPGGIWGSLFLLRRTGSLSMQEKRAMRPLLFLGISLTLLLVLGLTGLWVQAVFLFAMSVLAIVVLMNYIFVK